MAARGKKVRKFKIVFAFKKGVSIQKRSSLLGKIRSWVEVTKVEKVSSGCIFSPSLRLMYTLETRKEKLVPGLIERLKSFPEIKYAYLQSERKSKRKPK